jgi:hypothetical protein
MFPIKTGGLASYILMKVLMSQAVSIEMNAMAVLNHQ